jgi:tetratricopeptide (TPR) repeat protein
VRLAAALVVALCAGCAAGSRSDEAAPLDPDADLITINREAELAYESGESAKAEALYKSLVRRMPNDGETWFRLGNLYARNNLADQAANAYQKALMANNADARAWHNLGVVRLRQAWASMIQAHDHLKPSMPLYDPVEAILKQLEKIPLLEADGKSAVSNAQPAGQAAGQADGGKKP